MPDFTPAKRGDIAVISKIKRGYSLVAGCYSHLSITVGTVESVARDGTVKRVQPADAGCALTPRDWSDIQLIRAGVLADPAGFLAECKARQTPDPATFNPFADLNDVRETARKYRA